MHTSIISDLRPANAMDCHDIAKIYNQYLGTATMDTSPKAASYYSDFLEHKHPKEELWVLTARHDIIGWGIIKLYSPKLGYRYTCETSVYIHHDQRAMGYGTRMKIHLIDRCRHLGYHHLLARIFATNTVSIDYNKRLGYEIVGCQKEVGYVNHKWHDVVIMQLIL